MLKRNKLWLYHAVYNNIACINKHYLGQQLSKKLSMCYKDYAYCIRFTCVLDIVNKNPCVDILENNLLIPVMFYLIVVKLIIIVVS